MLHLFLTGQAGPETNGCTEEDSLLGIGRTAPTIYRAMVHKKY